MVHIAHKRTSLFGVMAMTLAILLSACGGGYSGSPQGGHPVAETAGSQPSVSLSAASGGSKAEIGTRSIPGIGDVLVDSGGLTLYRLTTDTSTKTTCTGSCAQTWPPLLTRSESAPASPGVAGQFGTLTRPDAGVQITFNGMPLYTYEGDSQPGQANGQGIGGVWFAVAS